MQTNERLGANGPGLPDATVHIVRDLILLALDATEPDTLTRENLLDARHALIDALDTLEGQA